MPFECDSGFFICEGEVGEEYQGENFRGVDESGPGIVLGKTSSQVCR
jgi:hypothetical protein